MAGTRKVSLAAVALIVGAPGVASGDVARAGNPVVSAAQVDILPAPYRRAEPARAATSAGVFLTVGDRVHLSSTPPPTMSAHGSWIRVTGPATLARVTVQIQQHWGGWVSVGQRGVKVLRPGRGAGNRATARARCHTYRGKRYTYRSVVDVDILGYGDGAEKAYTRPFVTNCSYLGRGR